MTGEIPYLELKIFEVAEKVIKGYRPAIPKGVNPDYKALMEQCWAATELDRPTFVEIVDSLESLLSKLENKK